jgi:hypothetical protein
MIFNEKGKNSYYGVLKNCWSAISYIIFLAALPTIFLLNGCASTDHVRDWSSSDAYKRDFENVMIMGLVNRISLRNDVEYALVDAAHKIGLNATNSMAMFPPELGKPFNDTERIRERLQEAGFDGILTVAVIDYTAERYVKPETRYVPLVYYNRFSNYYYRTEALVYKPGYFSLQTRYFLETNLYEINGGKLVWSGRSYVFEPQDIERFMPKYAKRLFKELLTAGIIDR